MYFLVELEFRLVFEEGGKLDNTVKTLKGKKDTNNLNNMSLSLGIEVQSI
jgi:hypothetical protein